LEEAIVKHSLIVTVAVALLSAGSAFAQSQATRPSTGLQVAGQDLSKMGPWTRKPTNERQTKKEITEFFNQEQSLMKSGDIDAMLARVDFPVYMATDDSKGVPKGKEFSREEYDAMMRPMMEDWPKDATVSHRPTITVLSDSLATYVDDFSMTVGGQRLNGRGSGLLVKRDGQWKWKAMMEPGWGDMPEPGVGGSPVPEESGTEQVPEESGTQQ
jgi:hypothetical protein